MNTILDIMKQTNLTVTDLAKKLQISTSQIHRWNRNGISKNNPHFYKLKEILPEIQPKEERITIKGEEDKRSKIKRKQKQLNLTETDIPSYQEPEFKSTTFPKIYMNKNHND